MRSVTVTSQISKRRTVIEVLRLTVASFVLATLAGIAFIVPMVALGYDIQTTVVLVGATAVGQVAMFGLGYGYVRYRDFSVPITRPTRSEIKYIIGGVLVALVAAVGLSALLSTLNLLPGSVIDEIASTDPTYLLGLAALSVVLIAAIPLYLFARFSFVTSPLATLDILANTVYQWLSGAHLHPLSSYLTVWPLVLGVVLTLTVGEAILRMSLARTIGQFGLRKVI
jgi:hypothetical protein